MRESNKHERQRLKNLARSLEKLQYKTRAGKISEEGQNTLFFILFNLQHV